MNTIDKIRAEIKRLEEIHERNLKKPMERGRIGFAHGVVECCDRILSFIDSLPEFNCPKLSDTLEEAAEKYEEEHTYQRYDGGGFTPEYNATLTEAFLAGAKWQKDQMMDEWLEDRGGCFWDGVAEGRKIESQERGNDK